MTTAINWPSGVNENVEAGSYAERPERNLVEFAPDVGPPMRRRRTAIASAIMSFNAIMTRAELDALLTFHGTTIKDGALSFNRKHPRTLAVTEFEFTEPPSASEIAGHVYRVTLALRVLP